MRSKLERIYKHIDEYYVIEGAGKVHGFPEAIKGCASVLVNYA
jgi:hypothetical protein